MEYLKLWKNQLDKLAECTTLEKGLILEACMNYQEGKEPTFPEDADGRFLRLVWADFRAMLDANSRKQETNAMNGAKGGRPGEARKEPEENPTETQQKPNGNPDETQAKPTEAKKQDIRDRKQETGLSSHTEQDTTPRQDARARGYTGPDGREHPCRYDGAWMRSARARGAVCQRVTDFVADRLQVNTGADLYGSLMDAIKSGVSPEWIEDAALGCQTTARLLALIAVARSGTPRSVPAGGGRGAPPCR